MHGCSGSKHQEIPVDHQRQWVTWLERVKSNRESAERIMAMIHAYEESKPSDSLHMWLQ